MILRKNNQTSLSLAEIAVFVCAPCMGKTTLAKLDATFIDMDRMKSAYKYGDLDETHEGSKGIANKPIVHTDSWEYIQKQTPILLAQQHKLLFNAKDEYLTFLEQAQIPFCLVYFHPNRLPELKEKMKQRGNNDRFISSFTESAQWEYYHKHQQNTTAAFLIELQANEHLEDMVPMLTADDRL